MGVDEMSPATRSPLDAFLALCRRKLSRNISSVGVLESVAGVKVMFRLRLTRRGHRSPFRSQKSRHKAWIAALIACSSALSYFWGRVRCTRESWKLSVSRQLLTSAQSGQRHHGGS